jgi:hypothetical protein
MTLTFLCQSIILLEFNDQVVRDNAMRILSWREFSLALRSTYHILYTRAEALKGVVYSWRQNAERVE